jgi:hypothetical protein
MAIRDSRESRTVVSEGTPVVRETRESRTVVSEGSPKIRETRDSRTVVSKGVPKTRLTRLSRTVVSVITTSFAGAAGGVLELGGSASPTFGAAATAK